MISHIAVDIAHTNAEHLLDAGGGLLLQGLHDHHIHLLAYAAALDSLQCGPPAVTSAAGLAGALRSACRPGAANWIRGIGYHPCVAGDIDRDWLDQHTGDHPVRIQHRGGRLWVLNSRALDLLCAGTADLPPGLERVKGRFTGRLFEGDIWLRSRLPSRPPALSRASGLLASYGITGITDTSPGNGRVEWDYLRECQERGELHQRVRMMGTSELASCSQTTRLSPGELKIHLLESRLPDWDELCRRIEKAHAMGRAVAVHCVTMTELVYTLAALESAGVRQGDRIEHASVCGPEQLGKIRELGLRVVIQPHFIAERGEQYLVEVEAADQPWLYLANSFQRAEIPLAGGSDAPFGSADPWRAMRAAIERRSASGVVMGADEALTPEQALQLFLSPTDNPGMAAQRLAPGAPADLCLLHCPWEQLRQNLDKTQVRATWCDGEQVFSST